VVFFDKNARNCLATQLPANIRELDFSLRGRALEVPLVNSVRIDCANRAQFSTTN
jgi:hypothetical protein